MCAPTRTRLTAALMTSGVTTRERPDVHLHHMEITVIATHAPQGFRRQAHTSYQSTANGVLTDHAASSVNTAQGSSCSGDALRPADSEMGYKARTGLPHLYISKVWFYTQYKNPPWCSGSTQCFRRPAKSWPFHSGWLGEDMVLQWS